MAAASSSKDFSRSKQTELETAMREHILPIVREVLKHESREVSKKESMIANQVYSAFDCSRDILYETYEKFRDRLKFDNEETVEAASNTLTQSIASILHIALFRDE